jgi:hypothetical protein
LLAAWPAGRWFDIDAALALGLPAPLRKRLSTEQRPKDASACRD